MEKLFKDYAEHYGISENAAKNILAGERWKVKESEYSRWYNKWSKELANSERINMAKMFGSAVKDKPIATNEQDTETITIKFRTE